MSLFFKAFAIAAIAFATSMANATTYHCQSLSGDAGGQVQLTTGGALALVTFSLIKNEITIGRIEFTAPPRTVVDTNLSGEKVNFTKYFDSINAGTVVVSSVLSVEASLFSGKTSTGLVLFQQQSTEKYLCQRATK